MITDSQPSEKAREFARDLIEDVAQLRIPELFSQQHSDAIYCLANRNGVSVVVLRYSGAQ